MPVPTTSPERGPYLTAALFCERVLDEKDNVKSLVRVIDRVNVRASGTDVPDTMPSFDRDLVGFLSFKAGEARGAVPIRVTVTKPSGLEEKAKPLLETTIHFDGGTRGHHIVLQIRMRFEEPGPYWFNVYVDNHLVTRTPVEIVFTTIRTSGPQPDRPQP